MKGKLVFQPLDPCKRDEQAFAIAGKVSGSHNSSYEKTMVKYKASRWPLSLHTWVEDHGARRGIGCAMESSAEFLNFYVRTYKSYPLLTGITTKMRD